MPRPPTLPRFATVPTGGYPGRVEPNAGRKDTGYDDGEAPPAGEHNWLFGLVGDWVEYLDGEASRLLLAALTDQANVFTAGQTIDFDSADEPVIATNRGAGDSVPATFWKLFSQAPTDADGGQWRLYGGDGGEGQFAIVINARWRVGTPGKWRQLNKDRHSTAIVINGPVVRVHAVPPGTEDVDDWETWPTAIGGELRFVDAICSTVTAGLGFKAGTSGDYAYDPVKLRTTNVPLMSVAGGAAAWIFSSFGEGGLSLGAGDIALFAIKLPAGARISAVEAMLDPAGASLVTLRAHRLSGHNWVTPTAPTGATVDSETTTGAALQVISVDFGAIFVQPDEELWVSVQGAQAGDVVWGLRVVDWEDPGPRNV